MLFCILSRNESPSSNQVPKRVPNPVYFFFWVELFLREERDFLFPRFPPTLSLFGTWFDIPCKFAPTLGGGISGFGCLVGVLEPNGHQLDALVPVPLVPVLNQPKNPPTCWRRLVERERVRCVFAIINI